MNHIIPLSVSSLFIATALLLSANLSAVADEKTTPTITISEDGLAIGEKTFLLGPSVSDLTTAWGTPSRVEKLANDVRIWDDLGVRSYSENGRTTVDSHSFNFKKQDMKLAAKSPFTGKLILSKDTISAATTTEDLQKLGFEQHEILKKLYQYKLPTASFLAETDPSDGSIVTISVEFGL